MSADTHKKSGLRSTDLSTVTLLCRYPLSTLQCSIICVPELFLCIWRSSAGSQQYCSSTTLGIQHHSWEATLTTPCSQARTHHSDIINKPMVRVRLYHHTQWAAQACTPGLQQCRITMASPGRTWHQLDAVSGSMINGLTDGWPRSRSGRAS
jgi:hypothetical protein